MTWEPHPDLVSLFESQWPLMRTLHQYGSLAPCAAYVDREGGIHGEAFTVEDGAEVPGADWVVLDFGTRYREQLAAQQILAAGVFFHGERHGDAVGFASSEEAANAIVAILEHHDGSSVLIVVPYARSAEAWVYERAAIVPGDGLPVARQDA